MLFLDLRHVDGFGQFTGSLVEECKNRTLKKQLLSACGLISFCVLPASPDPVLMQFFSERGLNKGQSMQNGKKGSSSQHLPPLECLAFHTPL